MSRPEMSATDLRRNLYRVLDEIELTGEPQVVSRKGRTFVLLATGAARPKLGDSPGIPVLSCTPDELVDTTWDSAWDREL